MQHYGLTLADNGSNWFFSGTEDAAWPDSLLSELKTVPAAQFDAIDESSLMVDPTSAAARTCGGASTLRPWWHVSPVPCTPLTFTSRWAVRSAATSRYGPRVLRR